MWRVSLWKALLKQKKCTRRISIDYVSKQRSSWLILSSWHFLLHRSLVENPYCTTWHFDLRKPLVWIHFKGSHFWRSSAIIQLTQLSWAPLKMLYQSSHSLWIKGPELEEVAKKNSREIELTEPSEAIWQTERLFKILEGACRCLLEAQRVTPPPLSLRRFETFESKVFRIQSSLNRCTPPFHALESKNSDESLRQHWVCSKVKQNLKRWKWWS